MKVGDLKLYDMKWRRGPSEKGAGTVSGRVNSGCLQDSDALIAMARQIVLLLALACSCAGFRAPAAGGRATRPALSRRSWQVAMDEDIDPKAAETNAEASDGSAGLR